MTIQEQLHPFILKHFDQLNKTVQQRKENNEPCFLSRWIIPRISLNDGTKLSVQFGYQLMARRTLFSDILFDIENINIMEVYLKVIYETMDFDIAVIDEEDEDIFVNVGQATLDQVDEFVGDRLITYIPEEESIIEFMNQRTIDQMKGIYDVMFNSDIQVCEKTDI